MLEQIKGTGRNPRFFLLINLQVKFISFIFELSKRNKMANKKRYDVLSPDGFSIHFSDTYATKKEAKNAFNEWKKRYESQGFYSSNKGRIPLNELEDYCKIIEVDMFVETM
jgi:hypothetical protein